MGAHARDYVLTPPPLELAVTVRCTNRTAECHHREVIDTPTEWLQVLAISSVLAVAFGAFVAWVVKASRR
jgi:hypothetical protein